MRRSAAISAQHHSQDGPCRLHHRAPAGPGALETEFAEFRPAVTSKLHIPSPKCKLLKYTNYSYSLHVEEPPFRSQH